MGQAVVISRHSSSKQTVDAARWLADNVERDRLVVGARASVEVLTRACAVLIRDGDWPGTDSSRVERLQAEIAARETAAGLRRDADNVEALGDAKNAHGNDRGAARSYRAADRLRADANRLDGSS